MYIPKRTGQEARRPARRDTEDSDHEGTELEEEAREFLAQRVNVEHMETAGLDYSEKAKKLVTDLLITQSPSLIDREHMKEVASAQHARFLGCLSLPFSISFFLAYALSTLLHEDITNVYFIESGLRTNIGAGIDNVVDIPGCWKWMNSTLIPTLFDQTNLFGEPEENKLYWNRVLMYNQLAGPLVIEQTRSKRELCFDGDGIYGDMVCYPMHTSDTKPIRVRKLIPVTPPSQSDYKSGNITVAQRKDFWLSAFRVSSSDGRRLFVDKQGLRIPLSRRLRIMRTEYRNKLPGGSASTLALQSSKYKASFYPNTPAAVTMQHVKFLQEGGWIDEQTKSIMVKFILLNAEVGRPRLAQVQIFFSFSRGGGVFARMTLESIFLKMWTGSMSMMADGAFAVILAIVTSFEILDASKAWKAGKFKKHLKRGWTILELLIVFFGWLSLLGYATQLAYMTVVKGDLNKVVDATKQDLPAESNTAGDELQESADSIVYFTSWFRILQAEYHLILMFRFFTAFAAQPRLGVVTSTLEASVVDIVHFLIVLLPTFVAYSISGVFLFGRRMKEFSTFSSAIGVCFKMAMEGEYDWEELSVEHYYTALIWTGTFMLLIVTLMMNMVLAIVLDIYGIKRKAAGNSETVDVTLYNLYKRFRHARVWVSNVDILKKADGMAELITREDMLMTFPGMCDEQLDPFMFDVKYQTELDATQSIGVKDPMKMTMAVKLAIDKVNVDMQDLRKGDLTKSIDDSTLVESEWLTGLTNQMASHSHWMLGIQWQLQQLQWQWSAMESTHGKDATFDGATNIPSGAAVVL